MPMSTSKFQARAKTRSFEQRAKAKARLLEDHGSRHCRRTPRRNGKSNIKIGDATLTFTGAYTGTMDLNLFNGFAGGGGGGGYADAGGFGYNNGGYAGTGYAGAGGGYAPTYTPWQYNTYTPLYTTPTFATYANPYYVQPQYVIPNYTPVYGAGGTTPYLHNLIPAISTTLTNINYGGYVPITPDTENAWGQWNQIGVAAQGGAVAMGDLNNALKSVENAWTNWNDQWTPSQRRRIERENAERRNHTNQLQENQRRAQVMAEERAMGIFLHTLTEEERASYEKEKCIYVRGNRGRRYRIRCAGQSGNVEWLDESGQMRGKFCAHPGGYVPDPDAWLAQKLVLMTDEDSFLGIANVHQGQRPALVPA